MSIYIHSETWPEQLAQATVNNPPTQPTRVCLYAVDFFKDATFTYWSPAEARQLVAQILAAADEAERINETREVEKLLEASECFSFS